MFLFLNYLPLFLPAPATDVLLLTWLPAATKQRKKGKSSTLLPGTGKTNLSLPRSLSLSLFFVGGLFCLGASSRGKMGLKNLINME